MLTGISAVSANATIFAGGEHVAPGSTTPGTFMTVAGNLAFQSGALYLVHLDPALVSGISPGDRHDLN